MGESVEELGRKFNTADTALEAATVQRRKELEREAESANVEAATEQRGCDGGRRGRSGGARSRNS